jgi:hypothetical protein
MVRVGQRRGGLLLAGVLLLATSARAPAAGEDLEQLWLALGTSDPGRAEQVIEALAAQPGRAVAFLRRRLQPVPPADPRKLAALLTALDSSHFRVRERATRELQEWGKVAEPFLRQALGKPIPLDVRRRIERLLATGARFHSAAVHLRRTRAIEVLERIGDAGARKVLAALGRGASEAQLTKEAKSALERLARPSATSP